MKHGIPTVAHPTRPECFYMRNLYHTFFWGPFESEREVIEAIQTLDRADEYWDYDPFCIIHGADPLPQDYVFGFPSVDPETRERIENSARPK